MGMAQLAYVLALVSCPRVESMLHTSETIETRHDDYENTFIDLDSGITNIFVPATESMAEHKLSIRIRATARKPKGIRELE